MSSSRHIRGGDAATAAVGFLVVMEFASGLLQGWFSPLLPAIGERFDASPAALNWVSAMYLLGTAACVPLIAKLGDLFGHKRLLVVATASVALGSFVVALAPSFAWLLVGRALQAPLAAFLPLEFAIVRDRNAATAGRSIGRLVGSLTLGAAVGGLLSGFLLDSVIDDVKVVLLVPAVLMTICLAVVYFLVPETTVRKAGTVDWAGAVLLTVGLLGVLGGVSNASTWGWTSALTWAAVGAGTVVLVLWVFVERRVQHPLVDLEVIGGGMRIPMLMALLFGAQLFGVQTPSALFLRATPVTNGYGMGVTASITGLILALFALAMFVGAAASDRLARSALTVPGSLALGAALAAVAYVLMIFVPGTPVTFALWLVVAGLGGGVVVGVLPTVIVQQAPPDSVGIASGLYNTSRTAAGAVAGAVFALLMSSMVTPSLTAGGKQIPSLGAYHVVWGVCAALCVATALLARKLRTPTPVTENGTSPIAGDEQVRA
ncbi:MULTISPECIES: MFS transporter [unclassified Rhodococcus (in: high G+C Gram-positive bacteria)]|uniref:MFS transporter n=1 Tax=unclassified Rhodococcus (in: high G+C Gram-positive bacteria) TaxID=192944 RepID=UPI00163999AC|nr:MULTISPECIES: MFS transporter [unclassified Rhodococcus (in: high G+C Gram-positive bacteria)]MBC2641290.1 MFS transporter [Rhodococcus sp. 3A]MBC2893965.1 MFS transporter [Rhodococcus sp. 4CII]